jgi:hypothetical protein
LPSRSKPDRAGRNADAAIRKQQPHHQHHRQQNHGEKDSMIALVKRTRVRSSLAQVPRTAAYPWHKPETWARACHPCCCRTPGKPNAHPQPYRHTRTYAHTHTPREREREAGARLDLLCDELRGIEPRHLSLVKYGDTLPAVQQAAVRRESCRQRGQNVEAAIAIPTVRWGPARNGRWCPGEERT